MPNPTKLAKAETPGEATNTTGVSSATPAQPKYATGVHKDTFGEIVSDQYSLDQLTDDEAIVMIGGLRAVWNKDVKPASKVTESLNRIIETGNIPHLLQALHQLRSDTGREHESVPLSKSIETLDKMLRQAYNDDSVGGRFNCVAQDQKSCVGQDIPFAAAELAVASSGTSIKGNGSRLIPIDPRSALILGELGALVNSKVPLKRTVDPAVSDERLDALAKQCNSGVSALPVGACASIGYTLGKRLLQNDPALGYHSDGSLVGQPRQPSVTSVKTSPARSN